MPELRRAFRARLTDGPIVVAPGTGDAFGARLIEAAGFEAIYLSGFVAAATYGVPDVGLLGREEMSERAAQICDATALPVVADADDGYGGVNNVARTVRAFERAGVVALHIEDQSAPKKCGSMAGKRLVSAEEMAGKIKAALDARSDENLLLIARTDAYAVEGRASVAERVQAYAEAGAEMLLVHGPYDEAVARDLIAAAPVPMAYFNSETLTMPILPPATLQALGVPLALYPLSMLLAATKSMRAALDAIRDGGDTQPFMRSSMVDAGTVNELLGLPTLKRAEERWSPKA